MGRELTVKIISKKEEKEYKCLPGKNLLEIIKDNGYFIDAICGGMGKCGKCTVIVDGEKKPACKTLIFNNCKVELPDQDIDRIVVPVDDAVSGENTNNETEVYACVDIGTTTICGALCDSKGNIIVRYNMLNHQRQYGADVMSRISAANKDSENLHNIIISDIEELIKKLIMNKKYKIAGVVISGNTTMMHIFRGYSCEGLGKYPYVPVSLSEEKISYTDVFENGYYVKGDSKIYLFPGISAFVGADIVSGLYYLDFDKYGNSLFIDMGTNGEMALWTGDKLFVTSTAAGPVFEGAGISCGTGSINGAVAHVEIKDDSCAIKTIGDANPSGICGTGVMELVSELRRNNIIDENGLLIDKYFERGYPFAKNNNGDYLYFTQNDIRQVQMAKAAIRTAIEMLLDKSGVNVDNLEKIFIAGGFGKEIRPEAIKALGLLPEIRDMSFIVAPGNTSLMGCIRFIKECDEKGQDIVRERIKKIAGSASEVALAIEDTFDAAYYEYMNFNES